MQVFGGLHAECACRLKSTELAPTDTSLASGFSDMNLAFMLGPYTLAFWLGDTKLAIRMSDTYLARTVWTRMFLTTGFINELTGEVCYHWQQVTIRYLRGWFWIDFLSTFPVGEVVQAALGGDGALADSTKLVHAPCRQSQPVHLPYHLSLLPSNTALPLP
eukprot:4493081-Pleurochrysis_carterae.AAC.5